MNIKIRARKVKKNWNQTKRIKFEINSKLSNLNANELDDANEHEDADDSELFEMNTCPYHTQFSTTATVHCCGLSRLTVDFVSLLFKTT